MQRKAVICGISNYDQSKLGKLHYAPHDALKVTKTLINHCGFERSNITVLTDELDSDFKALGLDPLKPNKDTIREQAFSLCSQAQQDDFILFYFAGHGSEIEKKPALIARDSTWKLLSETTLVISELNSIFLQSKAKVKLRVFDMCRTQAELVSRGNEDHLSLNMFETLKESGKGNITLISCSSGESSYETPDLQQGVFTYYLCQTIDQFSKKNPQVTLEEIVGQTKSDMARWTTEKHKKQNPELSGHLSGLIHLICPPPSNPTSLPHQASNLNSDLITGIKVLAARGKSLHDEGLQPVSVENFSTFAENFHTQLNKNYDQIKDHYEFIHTPNLAKIGPHFARSIDEKIDKFSLRTDLKTENRKYHIHLKSKQPNLIGNQTLILTIRGQHFVYIAASITTAELPPGAWSSKQRPQAIDWTVRASSLNSHEVLADITESIYNSIILSATNLTEEYHSFLNEKRNIILKMTNVK